MNDLVTVHQAARYMNVAPSTVQRWCRDGRLHGLRGIRYGRLVWLVSMAELLNFEPPTGGRPKRRKMESTQSQN